MFVIVYGAYTFVSNETYEKLTIIVPTGNRYYSIRRLTNSFSTIFLYNASAYIIVRERSRGRLLFSRCSF